MRCLAFYLLLIPQTLFALNVYDVELQFSLVLPDELQFEEVKDEYKVWDYHFKTKRKGLADGSTLLEAKISKQGGEVGLQNPHTAGDLMPVQWKGYTLYAYRSVRKERAGRGYGMNSIVTKKVTIPLRNRAIDLYVEGPENVEAAVDARLKLLLANLDGPSNWDNQPPAAAASPPAFYQNGYDHVLTTVGSGLLMLLFVLGIIYAVINRMKKPAPVQLGYYPFQPPAFPPPPAGTYQAVNVAQAASTPADPPPQQTAPATPEASCRYCGSPLRNGRRTCMSCGASADY